MKWGLRKLKPEQMKSPAAVKLAEKPEEITLTLGGTMRPYAWNIGGQEFPKADPIKLAANKSVRFVMVNPTMMDHPFHLHGHYFRVLGTPDKLNLTDPVQKDSVNIRRNRRWSCSGKPLIPGIGFTTVILNGTWRRVWPE